MVSTLGRALIVAMPVGAALVIGIVMLFRAGGLPAFLWTIGSMCLSVMVFTHVAEALNWWPAMQWGQSTSAGHYLDLTSAVFGLACLMGGIVIYARRRT